MWQLLTPGSDSPGYVWNHPAGASRFADTAFVRTELERGAQVNAVDESGWSPLHGAVASGNKEAVELLLEHRANVNAKNFRSGTPLHMAAKSGDLDVVRLLLEHGADVTMGIGRPPDAHPLAYSIETTPVHAAAEAGHTEVIELLIQYGANPRALDHAGMSPLLRAAVAGHTGAVNMLLDMQRTDDGAHDRVLSRVLEATVGRGRLEVSTILIDKGAVATCRSLDLAMDRNVGRRNILGRQEKTVADHEEIRLLLDHGAQQCLNNADMFGEGDMPLALAILSSDIEIVRLLLRNGADPTLPMNKEQRWRQQLLEGVSVRPPAGMLFTQTPRGEYRSALHLGCAVGSVDIVSLLIEGGAEVNATAEGGWSPLHIAAQRGDAEITKVLLVHGANPMAVGTSRGRTKWPRQDKEENPVTPLAIAQKRGYKRLVALMQHEMKAP